MSTEIFDYAQSPLFEIAISMEDGLFIFSNDLGNLEV